MTTTDITTLASAARDAARRIAVAPTVAKNAVLLDLASRVESAAERLVRVSAQDCDRAAAAGWPAPKLARLALTPKNLSQMVEGLRQIAALLDPVDQVTRESVTPAGLRVRKVRTPLGVIAMIYEARPGVTIDAFALCFKSGNACILKGGKEAAGASDALAELVHAALDAHGFPRAAAVVAPTMARDELRTMLALTGLIDLVIPRGGVDLIRFVHEHARIPVVLHFQGVCHVFVDASADVEKAVKVCVNAKASAPATCNAAECVLVHRDIAPRFIPALARALAEAGVELRADEHARALAPSATPAAAEDWGREFLDMILACRVVGGLDDAIDHIHRYGSDHTEAILTQDPANAAEFQRRVTASCVVVNASTRFNDGFQLGLGAEIGISTSRVHAYGPMGLEELTTQRYLVEGDYHTR